MVIMDCFRKSEIHVIYINNPYIVIKDRQWKRNYDRIVR